MSEPGGGRKTEMEEKAAGVCLLSLWFGGGKEPFIISARLERINCLGCWKFTFYTITLEVLFLRKVTAVKLMCGITVRTKKGAGRYRRQGEEEEEEEEEMEEEEVVVWVRLKQQKDCRSHFHTSRALVTGKLLYSAPSAVFLVNVCVCVCVCVLSVCVFVHVCLSTGNENSPCCCSTQQGHFAA